MMLKFSPANQKIKALSSVESISRFLVGRKVYSLDLLSGWSCPYAEKCLSKVIIKDSVRSILDGPKTEFRCFSASQELIFPNVFNLRKHNFDLLRNTKDKAELISNSMPANLGVCRIHVGGEMYNENYFLSWVEVAKYHKDRLFYAYTKSLPFWVRNRHIVNKVENLVLTASYGGRCDNLIKEYNLRSSKVILSPEDANGLEIDHDDSNAADPLKRNIDFALLIHGTQPKNSKASDAIKILKKNNIKFSYGRTKNA